jgi:hypothetical protein
VGSGRTLDTWVSPFSSMRQRHRIGLQSFIAMDHEMTVHHADFLPFAPPRSSVHKVLSNPVGHLSQRIPRMRHSLFSQRRQAFSSWLPSHNWAWDIWISNPITIGSCLKVVSRGLGSTRSSHAHPHAESGSVPRHGRSMPATGGVTWRNERRGPADLNPYPTAWTAGRPEVCAWPGVETGRQDLAIPRRTS